MFTSGLLFSHFEPAVSRPTPTSAPPVAKLLAAPMLMMDSIGCNPV